MTFSRRIVQIDPRFVGRDPGDYARELEDILLQLVASNDNGLPPGNGTDDPTTIEPDATGDAGTSTSGWAPIDHTHAIATAAPSNPTGTAASEGTGSSFMRADATIQQGIVTTKGDVLTYSSVPARLGVGANGLFLTANSAATPGIQWGPIVSSPTQLTASVNNYNPGRANLYRIANDGGSWSITGLVAGTDGEVRYMAFISASGDVTLVHDSGSSDAANRFYNVGNADINFQENEMAMLIYDGTSQRWRVGSF